MGMDEELPDQLATDLLNFFADALEGRKNCRGGIYRAGTGSAMYYLWHAAEIGASPDGRRKGEPFGTNYSPSWFARIRGPISVIKSFSKQNFKRADIANIIVVSNQSRQGINIGNLNFRQIAMPSKINAKKRYIVLESNMCGV